MISSEWFDRVSFHIKNTFVYGFLQKHEVASVNKADRRSRTSLERSLDLGRKVNKENEIHFFTI